MSHQYHTRLDNGLVTQWARASADMTCIFQDIQYSVWNVLIVRHFYITDLKAQLWIIVNNIAQWFHLYQKFIIYHQIIFIPKSMDPVHAKYKYYIHIHHVRHLYKTSSCILLIIEFNFYWNILYFTLFMLLVTCIVVIYKSVSGAWFNIKMSPYQYRKSHCGDKTVIRSYYLHNEISYTGKMTSLYWISPLDATLAYLLYVCIGDTEN